MLQQTQQVEKTTFLSTLMENKSKSDPPKVRLSIDVETSKKPDGGPVHLVEADLAMYGGSHSKRIIINLDKIIFDQPRKHGNPPGHADAIYDDFLANGYRYRERPMVVVQIKGTKLYRALSGHNRKDALGKLGETAYICDVVEFKEELGESEYTDRTNGDHPPSQPGNKADLINRITKDINEGRLDANVVKIKESLLRRAPHKKNKPAEIKTIVSEVVARVQPYEHFKTYYSDKRHTKGFESTTGTAGRRLGIPYFKDQNKDITEVGYIRKSFSKAAAGDMRKVLVDYDGQPVYLTFYVESPKDGPNSLKKQREGILRKFKTWVLEEKLYTAFKLGLSINDPIMDKFSIPFIITGFLDQDITPDTSKGGNPKEETLVDVDGNPVKDWRKGISIK